MHQSKRRRRRDRWRIAAKLRKLDALALKEINENMMWAMASWGGTRCPGCGDNIRPHWLAGQNLSGPIQNGWITAYGPACKFRKKCSGERNWS